MRQNLRYGLWFTRKDGPREEFAKVVELLGVGHLLRRLPGALSGGEKQRVAIGRALLSAPQMILADEPLASLDDARKAEILPYFERLRDDVSIPILYVSHASSEVARLATTVVAIEDGRVLRQVPAAEMLGDPSFTPLGPREAGALIETRVMAHHEDGLTEVDANGQRLLLPRLHPEIGAKVRVRIAAHDVILSSARPHGLSARNIIAGRVHKVRQGAGSGALVALDTDAGRLLARITLRSVDALALAPGKPCHAVIKAVSVPPADIGGAVACSDPFGR